VALEILNAKLRNKNAIRNQDIVMVYLEVILETEQEKDKAPNDIPLPPSLVPLLAESEAYK